MISILSFVFLNYKEPDFRGSTSSTSLVLLCLQGEDAAAACLSKVGTEVTQTLAQEKQGFLPKSSLGTLLCKAARLLPLKLGLFVKQRQHHHILLLLGANISSK